MGADSFADPLHGLDGLPWSDLQVAYGSARRVPDLIRLLASDQYREADRGWKVVGRQILCHQGTVYPGTVPAVHFLVQLGAANKILRRPRFLSYLAHLGLAATPQETAGRVRDAVRGGLPSFVPLLRSASSPLGLAIAELAAAFPLEMAEAEELVDALFNAEAEQTGRWALAGAKAMLGDWSSQVQDLLAEAEEASTYRAVRLPGGISVSTAEVSRDATLYGGRPLEDFVGLPVYTAVGTWKAGGRVGIEDDRFLEAARRVNWLFLDVAARVSSAP